MRTLTSTVCTDLKPTGPPWRRLGQKIWGCFQPKTETRLMHASRGEDLQPTHLILAEAKDEYFLPNADQHILDQLCQDGEGQLGFSHLEAAYGQEKS